MFLNDSYMYLSDEMAILFCKLSLFSLYVGYKTFIILYRNESLVYISNAPLLSFNQPNTMEDSSLVEHVGTTDVKIKRVTNRKILNSSFITNLQYNHNINNTN